MGQPQVCGAGALTWHKSVAILTCCRILTCACAAATVFLRKAHACGSSAGWCCERQHSKQYSKQRCEHAAAQQAGRICAAKCGVLCPPAGIPPQRLFGLDEVVLPPPEAACQQGVEILVAGSVAKCSRGDSASLEDAMQCRPQRDERRGRGRGRPRPGLSSAAAHA